MEEKKNTPNNASADGSPKTEIDALLKEMIKKESASGIPIKDDNLNKTPLENLKHLLSHADAHAAVLPAKENRNTPTLKITADKATPAAQETAPRTKMKTEFLRPLDLKAVAKLDELIRAHREKSGS